MLSYNRHGQLVGESLLHFKSLQPRKQKTKQNKNSLKLAQLLYQYKISYNFMYSSLGNVNF